MLSDSNFRYLGTAWELIRSRVMLLAPFYGNVSDNTVVFSGLTLSQLAIASGDYQAYSTYTNSKAPVKSYGASLGVSTKVFGNYDLGGSYTYAKLDFDQSENPDFQRIQQFLHNNPPKLKTT